MTINKSKIRAFIGSGIAMVFFVLLANTLFAAFVDIPFAGSVARSFKYHDHYEPNAWYANIESSMDNGAGPAIDVIGWSFWNIYDKCNGAYVDDHYLNGTVGYNVKFQGRTSAQYIANCNNGSRQTVSNGYHQFEEGSDSIAPWVQEIRTYP
ncbi:hypothetical protein MNBD_CHLOROFLEXI01-4055 [hydrothermal vent metagenome]|uniref:Uncharacterized protein n=1 Tax=hydrothermal vent metagenome TaxID=652676 RepID=A0A3B0W0Y4_9ZZZZ